LEGFCTQLLSSSDAGRDAAQEAFVKAYQSLNSYNPESSFQAWIFRIARNHCIDLLRKRKRHAEEEFHEGTHAASMSSPIAALEAKDLAEKILSQLSEKDREVVLLREAYELNYDAIAEITGATVDSIKGRLKRARKELLVIAKKINKHTQVR
jgi:RNA polymerase sigma-70 factor (ECF subfamily)